MFKNEVKVDPKDKQRLVELLAEAQSILDKYPYFSVPNCNTVTCMSRAKSFVNDAYKWVTYLYTTDSKEKIE